MIDTFQAGDPIDLYENGGSMIFLILIVCAGFGLALYLACSAHLRISDLVNKLRDLRIIP